MLRSARSPSHHTLGCPLAAARRSYSPTFATGSGKVEVVFVFVFFDSVVIISRNRLF